MDKFTKLERIIDLAVRLRDLDLHTARVVNTINQQQVNLYKAITGEYVFQDNLMDAGKKGKKNMDIKLEPKISPTDMAEMLQKMAADMKRLSENPPEEPTPPAPPTPPEDFITKEDLEKLGTIKKLSATVSEHLKMQVDHHKYATAAMLESQKLSFELFKQLDEYMSSKRRY